MLDPLVSIVMATYNSEKYLHQTVASILAQGFQDWELVIVDDASSDGTRDLIQTLAESDERIKYAFNATNSGAAVSRNKAITKAKGRYLAFLDSDDLWMSDKLSVQLECMRSQQLPITFTSYNLIDEAGNDLGRDVDVKVPLVVDYRALLAKRVTFGCSTVMIDRNMVGDVLMPLLRTGQDYATWLSILKRGHHATRIPKVLTSYRITPGSISRNKFKKALRQWQIYTKLEGLGWAESVYYMFHYARRALIRK